MKILLSEWMKTKRTPVRWITFLTPVIFAALIVWYFSFRTITADTQISIFEAFFEVWATMVIPVGAGLIPGIMIHQEELAGCFNGFLGSKLPRRDLYVGKFIMLALLASVSTLLGVLALIIGSSLFLRISVSWSIFLRAAIMAMIGTLPLLAFHLWISLAWGMGASIGIGSGGILIAALMATSLGDQIWPFVPWAWPVRLSLLTGAELLDLTGMNLPSSVKVSDYITSQAVKCFIPAAVLFAVLLSGGLIWFQKWEGRKLTD